MPGAVPAAGALPHIVPLPAVTDDNQQSVDDNERFKGRQSPDVVTGLLPQTTGVDEGLSDDDAGLGGEHDDDDSGSERQLKGDGQSQRKRNPSSTSQESSEDSPRKRCARSKSRPKEGTGATKKDESAPAGRRKRKRGRNSSATGRVAPQPYWPPPRTSTPKGVTTRARARKLAEDESEPPRDSYFQLNNRRTISASFSALRLKHLPRQGPVSGRERNLALLKFAASKRTCRMQDKSTRAPAARPSNLALLSREPGKANKRKSKDIIAHINASPAERRKLKAAKQRKRAIQKQWQNVRAQTAARRLMDSILDDALNQSSNRTSAVPSPRARDTPKERLPPMPVGRFVVERVSPTPKRLVRAKPHRPAAARDTPTRGSRSGSPANSSGGMSPARVDFPVGNISAEKWEEIDELFTIHELPGNTVIDILLSVIKRQDETIKNIWASPSTVAVMGMEREPIDARYTPTSHRTGAKN